MAGSAAKLLAHVGFLTARACWSWRYHSKVAAKRKHFPQTRMAYFQFTPPALTTGDDSCRLKCHHGLNPGKRPESSDLVIQQLTATVFNSLILFHRHSARAAKSRSLYTMEKIPEQFRSKS